MHEEASATTMSGASSSVAASTSQPKAGVASVLAMSVSPEAQVPDGGDSAGELLPYEDGSTGTFTLSLTAYMFVLHSLTPYSLPVPSLAK